MNRRPPVLFLPGLLAGDRSTAMLRAGLALRGHPVHRWHLGRNDGPTPEVVTGLRDRLRSLHERYERPVAIVGWSLGGVYAWELGRISSGQVHAVVTLGSPLRPMTNPWPEGPVPVTSIWTTSDEIVPWRQSQIDEGPRRENIEVRGTHLTLGFDPVVIGIVADRLAQRPERWRPFRPAPWTAPLVPRRRAAARPTRS